MPLAARIDELQQLDAIRLDRDWTWQELADSMARARVQMSPRTLHYLVKAAPRNAHPNDRTLHKIRTYLARLQDQDQQPDQAPPPRVRSPRLPKARLKKGATNGR